MQLQRDLYQRQGRDRKYSKTHIGLELAKAKETMMAQQEIVNEKSLYLPRIIPLEESGAV